MSTAAVPFGQAGAVVYGPNVNAAAVLLASQGNVPIERSGGDGGSAGRPQVLADLRERLDKATYWGMITNRCRDWSRNNGVTAIDAIHTALLGRPWLPSPVIA